ncbi:MAG: AAA family ATPase [Sphingomonadales bacterium]
MNQADQQAAVFGFLADPASHGLDQPVTRIDTHGAVLFLAGDTVYKVKRAVRYAYMDFSTLAKRRQACLAEIALNQPLAPAIYRDVVAITREADGLAFNGQGVVLDYAVRMRRFDERRTLDHLAAKGQLDDPLLGDLAVAVARLHDHAPRHRDFDFAARLAAIIAENRRSLEGHGGFLDRAAIARLDRQSQAALARAHQRLARRQADGFVRRCHGDLHLRNLVMLDGAPTPFDALEFDDALATGDVLYDFAFLLMDLIARDLVDAANYLFNRYLLATGAAHLSALGPLPLFIATRAAIRAKVAADLAALAPPPADCQRREAMAYLALANRALASAAPPRLVAIGGLSGSGKSTLARALAPALGGMPGAVHLRSDVERKRLFDCPETQKLAPSAYRQAVTRQVYQRLYDKAAQVLAGGHWVIVDAVHQRPEEQARLAAIAAAAGADFTGLWLDAPLPTLIDRVAKRQGDASDADAAVVQAQAARRAAAPAEWRRIATGGGIAASLTQARAALGLDPAS